MTDLATLHRDVVFNRSDGRIIWQPRIGCWYTDKIFAGEPLPEPYRGKTVNEIHRQLGCSARLYDFNSCFRCVEDPRCERTSRPLNDWDTEVTRKTPMGKQVEITRRSPDNPGITHPKWEDESEEELKVATWRAEHATWEWDQLRYEQLLAEQGDLGAPTMFMPRMNVQDLYLNTMGVENGIYALLDWPDTTEAYFRALHESHDRLIDIINTSPIDIINFGENVHCATLSPDLFRRYHLPECLHRCERLHGAGKFISAHWDGNCGPLLPYAQETGLDGIEAITPKPQGDVTIEEVREAMGDDMFLLDGIPAVYFDETFPVETLIACTKRIIELFAPKLVLGISDEISSTGDIERIRIVGDIVKEYNDRKSNQPDACDGL